MAPTPVEAGRHLALLYQLAGTDQMELLEDKQGSVQPRVSEVACMLGCFEGIPRVVFLGEIVIWFQVST